jgi:hypothetical protein
MISAGWHCDRKGMGAHCVGLYCDSSFHVVTSKLALSFELDVQFTALKRFRLSSLVISQASAAVVP